MPRYGLRDGKVTTNSIVVTGELLSEDVFKNLVGSASGTTQIFASQTSLYDGTSIHTIITGTQPDAPRAIKIVQDGTGRVEPSFSVYGYNSLGEYVSESLTVGTTAGDSDETNYAYIYVGSVVPQSDYLTSGGTVSARVTDKIGLSKKIKDNKSVIFEERYYTASADLISKELGQRSTVYTDIGHSTVYNRVNATYNTLETKTHTIPWGSTLVVKYKSSFQRE